MMLTLDLAISTYKPEGIERVSKQILPPVPGINYVVSWQQHEDAPVPDILKKRPDVKIYRYDKKGLSNNRNNSILHSTADIVLICDDDVVYLREGLMEIRKKFTEGIQDVGLFKIDFLNKKQYPERDTEVRLPFPKNYYPSSVEIAVRRKSIRNIKFNPALGLGAPTLHCGEEEVFLADCIRKGLLCKFFPIEIGRHLEKSTGDKITPQILRGQAFVIKEIYGKSTNIKDRISLYPRLLIKAWRISRKKEISFLRALKYLL